MTYTSVYVLEVYHPKYKLNWKFMMTDYEISRRKDTIESMRVIRSYPDYKTFPGEEMGDFQESTTETESHSMCHKVSSI